MNYRGRKGRSRYIHNLRIYSHGCTVLLIYTTEVKGRVDRPQRSYFSEFHKSLYTSKGILWRLATCVSCTGTVGTTPRKRRVGLLCSYFDRLRDRWQCLTFTEDHNQTTCPKGRVERVWHRSGVETSLKIEDSYRVNLTLPLKLFP